MYLQDNVGTVTLPIMPQAQRSVALGSQATNQAFSMHGGQEPSLYHVYECTNNIQRASTLSCLIKGVSDQETGHVSSLQV